MILFLGVPAPLRYAVGLSALLRLRCKVRHPKFQVQINLSKNTTSLKQLRLVLATIPNASSFY